MPIDYRAPLDDMQFVLHRLIPISAVANLPGYEDVSSDLVNTILDEAV